jgi:hypothetical protein
MTVSSTTTSVSYTGDASTTDFAVTFPFLGTGSSSELTVVERVIATGAETTKSYTSHFTVTGGDGETGTVIAASAPASTVQWHIRRNTTATQTTDYVTNDPFAADTFELSLDRLAMSGQERDGDISQAFSFPDTYTGGASTTFPEPVANAYLLYNAAADALTTSDSSAAQYLGGNGTVSLPFYSYSSDPNSGAYRIGADNIGWAVNGVKGLDLSTSGLAVTGTLAATAITGSGILSIDDTTESSSTTTGSVHADGGLGVAKKLYVGGITTHGADVLSDTDSTDSLGSTGVRWLKLWVDSIQTTANLDVAGSVVITGSLTVNGTTITNDATNTTIKDPLIELNSGAGSNANDLGFIFERGSTGNNAFLGWDESGDFFAAGTTTATGASTGNITYSFAPFKCSAITATSGTLAGLTSIAMAAGATLTAGFLDEDDMSSNSAVAGVTQQSIKAYVDNNAPENGVKFAFESTTTDTDQGVGKVWLNNGTPSSATVLYVDDVEAGSVSVNAWVDTWDDVSNAVARGYVYIASYGTTNAILVFKVTGAVTSASTYSKVAVTHVLTVGTISDGDNIGLTFVPSGVDGSGDMSDLVDDTTPQLGGFLDTNSKFISHAQGAAIASVAGDTNIWTNFDGNTVHITGTNAITDFGTPKSAGDSMWVIFDAAASVVDSATITVAGNTNYQAAANDLALVYALTTSTFLFMPFPNSGASPVAAAGGGGWLGESGSPLGTSADIVRVNEQTLNNSISIVGTDNASATGPLAIASGITVTVSSGATFAVI